MKKRNFSQTYEIIKDKFIEQAGLEGKPLTMSRFLGYSNKTKVESWSKGQWPSAEDIAILHQKLGFSYEWLVTGEGDPYGTITPCTQATPNEEYQKNIALLQKEISDLKEKCELQRDLIAMYKERDKGDTLFAHTLNTANYVNTEEA